MRNLECGRPFRDLPQVSVEEVRPAAGPPPDLELTLNAAGRKVLVYGEVKNQCTPLATAQIVPWLAQLKRLRPGAGMALVCPSLSPAAQKLCTDSNVDFIDMAGNVSISVPGVFYLYRVGMELPPELRPPIARDPFSGRATRVLRVLLEKRGPWRATAIEKELAAQSAKEYPSGLDFTVSPASVSKTLKSLEQELLIRREESGIVVPEPKRLLLRWAEKYRERYRWRSRSSFRCSNPFGASLPEVSRGLRPLVRTFAFTGAAAASLQAPYVDLDAIDVMVELDSSEALRDLTGQAAQGAGLRIVIPFDNGAFMYPNAIEGLPLASDVQTFLDLYARGGRDLKQAEYFLSSVLEPRWSTT